LSKLSRTPVHFVATDDVKIGLMNECTNQRGAKGVGVNCGTLGGTRYSMRHLFIKVTAVDLKRANAFIAVD